MDQAEKLRAIAKKQETELEKATKEKNARIIAVTSGKGGVGKSSLTLNMAASLAKLGKKVLIIDADLGLANIQYMLGISPTKTIRDLINHNKSLQNMNNK